MPPRPSVYHFVFCGPPCVWSGSDQCKNVVQKGPFDATYPIPFETVLGAEEASLDAQLQTCRTLQSPSFVATIGPGTLFPVIGHGGDFSFELETPAESIEPLDG